MKHIFFFILLVLLMNCKTDNTEKLTAGFIINKSIEIAGADKVGNSLIEFDFRDKFYYAERSEGEILLARFFIDDKKDSIYDMLSNNDFIRLINDKTIAKIDDSTKAKYAASVNSVHYFSVLPYGLNDKAVNKTRLMDIEIIGNNYYTIQITFDEDGGGEDYEDVFLYWINTKTYKIDYLAYSYNELDGKGVRFREAYNERYINDIRFVDYNNYKPKEYSETLSELPILFENGQLQLLSKIELENVIVN